MSNSSAKRKNAVRKMAANAVTGASNVLIDNCHDYATCEDNVKLSLMNDEDFPSLPVTPEKPPSKKGKNERDSTDIVATLSELINARSDELKTLVQNNTVQISSLRVKMESVCKQVSEVKGKVSQLELAVEGDKKHINMLESRITEMERYSRRWNLKLHGVAERVEDKDVRKEVIRVCQALLPSDAERLLDVIDTAPHRGEETKRHQRHHRAVLLPHAQSSSVGCCKEFLLPPRQRSALHGRSLQS